MKNLFFIFLFFSLLSPSYAQEYPITILPEGHIVVQVNLNDSIPANFILDTGGGANILSASTFEKVKAVAKESGHFTGFRHDGDRLDGVVYEIPSLTRRRFPGSSGLTIFSPWAR